MESALSLLFPVMLLRRSRAAQYTANCPKKQFFDDVTGRCAPCYDICYLAEYKKTTESCKRLCPDYLPDPSSNSGISGGIVATVAVVSILTVGIFVVLMLIFRRRLFSGINTNESSSTPVQEQPVSQHPEIAQTQYLLSWRTENDSLDICPELERARRLGTAKPPEELQIQTYMNPRGSPLQPYEETLEGQTRYMPMAVAQDNRTYWPSSESSGYVDSTTSDSPA